MVWWKAFDLTGISTLIILTETCPELVLETSECKIKQPHRFLVQQNFQSMTAPDQFSISHFRHTIWLCKMEKAGWTFENTVPANKHTNNFGTQQGHPRIFTIYHIFILQFYTSLFSWLDLILVIITVWLCSQPHQNLQ